MLIALQDEPKPPVPSSSGSSWLWIAGGTLVAAGLGTGAYFLLRPDDAEPPPPTPGTFSTIELPLRWGL